MKPLYKKGENTEPKNYRPVLLLPILSKISERVVSKQLIQHLEKHYILFEYPIWFSKQTLSKHFSCSISQSDTKGFWVRNINRNDVDLQKAFKTLHYDIHFFHKQLESDLIPQSCLYFQGFQGSKLLIGCLVVCSRNLCPRRTQ